MSVPAEIAKADAGVRRAVQARDEARSCLWVHEKKTQDAVEELAKVERVFIAHATDMALEGSSKVELPDAADVEKLRAAVAIGAPIEVQLQERLDAQEADLAKLLTRRDEIVSDHLVKRRANGTPYRR